MMLREVLFFSILIAPLGPFAHAQDFSHQSTQPAPQTSLIQQANDALASGDYAAALKILTTLNAQLPNNPQVLYDVGLALDALSDTAPTNSASPAPNSAESSSSSSSSVPAAPATAEAAYRAAIAADSAFPPPHVALGLLLARNGNSTDARTQLTSAAALPNVAPALKASSAPSAPSPALTSTDRICPATPLIRSHPTPPPPPPISSPPCSSHPSSPEDILLSAQIGRSLL